MLVKFGQGSREGVFFRKPVALFIDDGVHCSEGLRGLHTQEGAIKQLVIRTVSADA